MLECPNPNSVRIATCPGALAYPFLGVLARQREAEPETQPRLIETGITDQIEGLAAGRYDIGLSLEPPMDAPVASVPMWRDEVAVALPKNHPLLAQEDIALDEIARHPLVLWCPRRCESLSAQVNTLLHVARRPLNVTQWAVSFDTLAMMVASGFGLALAAKSRIVDFQKAGILMRPLAGAPHYLTTYLLHPVVAHSDVGERFVERARTLSLDA